MTELELEPTPFLSKEEISAILGLMDAGIRASGISFLEHPALPHVHSGLEKMKAAFAELMKSETK